MRLVKACQLSTPTTLEKTSNGTIPYRCAEQDSLNLSGTCCCGQIRGRLREQVQSWTYTDNRQSHFPAWRLTLSPNKRSACPAHARYLHAIWFPSRLRPSKSAPTLRPCWPGPRFRCAIRCAHRKGAPDGKPTPNAQTYDFRSSLTRSTFPVHYPVLAPEMGLRWQTHAQPRNLWFSVRPGHPAPGATLPAIPAAGESATPSIDWPRRWHSTANSARRRGAWSADRDHTSSKNLGAKPAE